MRPTFFRRQGILAQRDATDGGIRLVYLDLVVLLNFLVDLMILLGTNRLAGFPPGVGRCILAALLGSVYAGGCLLPGFYFLGNGLWRTAALIAMAMIAFGINRSAVQRGAVFVLLSMALGGIAMGSGKQDFGMLILCGVVLWFLCRVSFRGNVGSREYVPIQLTYEGKCVSKIALRDTGNTLKDPLTGEGVLIAGPDTAAALLNLTEYQLCHPVETLASGCLPGLRLIPYCSVGQTGGMLLAFRFRDAKIGGRQAAPLVAFAPEMIGKTDVYQMLTGGVI